MDLPTRIAVVNRGEAACRLIHAVRELNTELVMSGGSQVRTIALYTEPERHARFAREADSACCLGPASARPYLDLAVLERALIETAVDAAWAGWGFVAEYPAFAELCDRLGVTFIGPGAGAMRKLGDKIGAKLVTEEIGVPVAAWSRGPVLPGLGGHPAGRPGPGGRQARRQRWRRAGLDRLAGAAVGHLRRVRPGGRVRRRPAGPAPGHPHQPAAAGAIHPAGRARSYRLLTLAARSPG